jgi:uncharacterized membrane protein YhaH (DUF805 family)
MRIRASDLWSFSGTIDRDAYAFWGICLSLIKFLLDQLVVRRLLGPEHLMLNYWFPGDAFGLVRGHPPQSAAWIALLAVPFVLAGTALTLRRLRAVRWPPLLIFLFFVPVLNLILFAMLVLVPSKPAPTEEGVRPGSLLGRVLPVDPVGSAAMAVALTGVVSVGLILLFANVLGDYGWGLFLGVPFFLGLSCALLHHIQRLSEADGRR